MTNLIYKAPHHPIISMTGEIPGYLTRDEVHRILDSVTRPRDRLMIDFLWQTGVRVSEMIHVKAEDVDSYLGVVRINTLKKRGPKKKKYVRSIPIPKEFINKVEDYALEAHISPSDRLFPVTRQDIYHLVNRYCRRAGIDTKRSHPHTFRHSFAVNAALQGASGTILAEWLGHADISSVMIYARALAQDTRHIREGMEF